MLYHARHGLVRKDFPAVKGGVEQWRSWRDGFEVSCASCNLVMADTGSYHSFCGVRGGFSSTTFQADAYFQTHHIAHDSDLIILDFDVNDQP